MLQLSKFGSYLVDRGYLDQDVVEKAHHKLQETGDVSAGALARLLVKEFKVQHDLVYEALSKMYAFPSLDIRVDELSEKKIQGSREIWAKFPDDLKTKLLDQKIFPFAVMERSREILQILAADPTDNLIQEIPKQTQFKRIETYWSKQKTIEDLISKVIPQKNAFLVFLEEAGDVLSEMEDVTAPELDETALDEEINKSLLVNLFEGALVEAVQKDASDVHFIPKGKTVVEIYFRIDGKLQLWHKQENTPPEALISVVKDRSVGVDRFERDTAQDGFAQRLIDNTIIRFRISIIPIVSAEYERRFESVVVRVIDDRKVITDFMKLGFQKQAESEFVKSISTSKGIVIVTGPTGSGKSTTLMAALHHVISPTINVLTCEDPVEYVIHGARQLKISHKMSFEQAIRAILRHDPDVVMVGEIRDKETADIAVKLANTGHLTFSTLHTNDAPSAITRLYKMGIETFLLAYSINIIIAQRLVRKLCVNCRKPLGKEHWDAALQMGFSQEELESGIIFEAVGCSKCTNGYKGRVNIAEALYFYPEIKTEIINSKDEIDEERIRDIAEKHGMLSMRASGMDRIRNGLTDITEVLFATAED